MSPDPSPPPSSSASSSDLDYDEEHYYTKGILHSGDGEELPIQGFSSDGYSTILFWSLVVVSLGSFYLIYVFLTVYTPRIAALLRYRTVPLEEAQFVLVENERTGTCSLCEVQVVLLKDTHSYGGTTSHEDGEMKKKKDPEEEETESKFSAFTRTSSRMISGFFTPDSQAGTEYSVLLSDSPHIKYIEYGHTRYIYSRPFNSFYFLSGLDGDNPMKRPRITLNGLNSDDVSKLHEIYGRNELKIKPDSYLKVFVDNILDVFYLFQVLTFIIWCIAGYYYYALGIVIFSAAFIAAAVIRIKQYSDRMLAELDFEVPVTVIRDGYDYEVSHHELVPGDIVVINKSSKYLTFDGVLLTGHIYLDIASLKGVTIPAIKRAEEGTAIADRITKLSHDSDSSLFSGSRVVGGYWEEGKDVLALVVNTGFLTEKGRVFHKAGMPETYEYSIDQDGFTYFQFLIVIGAISFTVAMVLFKFSANYLSDDFYALIQALRLVTLSIPPSLPLGLTMAYIWSSRRLEREDIGCRNYRRIYVGGKISCVVFDKTGTLTVNSTETIGYVPVEGTEAVSPSGKESVENRTAKFGPLTGCQNDPIQDENILYLMATCHDLRFNETSGEDEDEEQEHSPDRVMFKVTGWKVNRNPQNSHTRLEPPPDHQPPGGGRVYADVISLLPFTSEIKYMAVIVKIHHEGVNGDGVSGHEVYSGVTRCYVKGEPTTILTFCQPDSVPPDTLDQIEMYTRQGFIVVCLAYKDVNESRDDFRSQDFPKYDLTFLGLLIFGDRLVEGAKDVISNLQHRKFQTLMCTGDNIHTAVHVAREAGILPPKGSFKPADKVIQITAYLDRFGALQIEAKDYDTDAPYEPESAWGDSWSPPHFVTDGTSWEVLDNAGGSHLDRIIIAGKVFARMTPRQKKNLVELKRKVGFETCMVGDGSNDNEALQEADVGISLNNRESGLAASFQGKDITAVPRLLNEGRTSLLQLLTIFMFTGCHTVIGMFGETYLYSMLLELSEIDWIYIDLFLVMSIDLMLGYTESRDTIKTSRRTETFWNALRVSSNAVFVLVCIAFQIGVIVYIHLQAWYRPAQTNHSHLTEASYESTYIFAMLIFQLTFPAIIYTMEHDPIYKNIPLLVIFGVLYTINTYIVVYPAEIVVELFELMISPSVVFRITILLILVVNLIVNILMELGFIVFKRQSSGKGGH